MKMAVYNSYMQWEYGTRFRNIFAYKHALAGCVGKLSVLQNKMAWVLYILI